MRRTPAMKINRAALIAREAKSRISAKFLVIISPSQSLHFCGASLNDGTLCEHVAIGPDKLSSRGRSTSVLNERIITNGLAKKSMSRGELPANQKLRLRRRRLVRVPNSRQTTHNRVQIVVKMA